MASATVVLEPVVQRVVAAHDALQLGELADHVGHAGRPWPAARPGRRCVASVGRRPAARRCARAMLHARAPRARPACPACCDRPPWPAPRRARPASSCGPGRRRTWHRPGAGAPRARCRRSPRSASSGRMLLTTRNLLVSLPWRVEQREILLVGLHREDQAFLRHVEELASRTRRPARWGARPAR